MRARPAGPILIGMLAFLVLALETSRPVAAQPTDVNDLVWSSALDDAGNKLPLHMDIYMPRNVAQPPFPLVVWVHGGAWRGGTYQTLPGFIPRLLEHSMAVASIEYRLSPQAIFPAQIHDVKGAIRYLRANAQQYALDATRIGIFGSSAGGHLAALAATSGDEPSIEGDTGGNAGYSSRVIACADYFGPTDLLNLAPDVTVPPGNIFNHDAPDGPGSELVGWDQPGQGLGDIRAHLSDSQAPYPMLVQRCNEANPIYWATADDPPTFIAHGAQDTSVPLNQSGRLATALNNLGVPGVYRIIPAAGHGNLGSATDDAMILFFEQRVVARPRVPGDLTGDRRVSEADLGILLNSFLVDARADIDLDGDTDESDLGLMMTNWGVSDP